MKANDQPATHGQFLYSVHSLALFTSSTFWNRLSHRYGKYNSRQFYELARFIQYDYSRLLKRQPQNGLSVRYHDTERDEQISNEQAPSSVVNREEVHCADPQPSSTKCQPEVLLHFSSEVSFCVLWKMGFTLKSYDIISYDNQYHLK